MNYPTFEDLAKETTISEVVWKKCACRTLHQTYSALISQAMNMGWPDTKVCEFGNNEEHRHFFGES